MTQTSPISSVNIARILVFDSGVGGLSILQEVHKQYPNCKIFYGSDNKAFPYGTKSELELVERVNRVLHLLQQVSHADIIVVACNTASTIALPRIRECFPQPIIGVVPAIKPAAAISQSKTIGLLATPGTITREYTDNLITHFASDCQVIRLGSSELVELAEKKLRGAMITSDELASVVSKFQAFPDIDTVVLACTHFPLLKQELQLSMPSVTHWIDSGKAIARRVGYWLDEKGFQAFPVLKTPQNITAYFTELNAEKIPLEHHLRSFSIDTVNYLST